MLKVLKFGGSSLADARQFAKVKSIVEADPARRVVIVSAPGKRFSGDHKITDLLYLCAAHIKYGVSCEDIFAMIRDRYNEIIAECGLKLSLDKEFDELWVIARREDRLRELQSKCRAKVRPLTLDLQDRASFAAYRALLESEKPEISVLVNAAGFGLFGEFVTADLDEELRMIDTNVRAVHILTKLAVRDFVQRGRGYILNVSSSAGFLPGPLMATYYATKNYVLRLTEALREELRRAGSPVRVCALCPGPVDTEFNKVAGVRFSLSGLSAERVAREAVDGLFAGKAVVVPGAAMKAMTLARHFAPDSILARITYHFQHKKGAK